jgi:hypothetical protein
MKEFKEMYGEAYVKAYLYAASVGCDLSFFPHKIPVPPTKVRSEFIDRFVALWPKQSVTGLEYPVSGNRPEVLARFNKLIKTWSDRTEKPFDEYAILQATEDYLKVQREKGWQFTKKNHKFVLDENGSELIAWLEKERSKPQDFYL